MQLKSLATAKMTAKAAAILAVGALTLTACGGGSSTPAASEGGIQLINAGKLTVCSDVPYEPFEFQKDGKIVGFDMDIAAEVAKDLEGRTERRGQLLRGHRDRHRADPVRRLHLLDLHHGHPQVRHGLLRPRTWTTTWPWWPARTPASRTWTTPRARRWASSRPPPAPTTPQEKGIDAQQFEDTGLLVQALQAGTIDAALGNQSVLGYAIKDDPKFKRVENFATGEKLGISIKKGNTAMAEKVNATLKRLTDDGSLKKFETTWFGEAAK